MNAGESHDVPHSDGLVPHMFSDESNKLETYTFVRTKEIILKKKSLSGLIHFEIYIYIYIERERRRERERECVCVCVCVCARTRVCVCVCVFSFSSFLQVSLSQISVNRRVAPESKIFHHIHWLSSGRLLLSFLVDFAPTLNESKQDQQK